MMIKLSSAFDVAFARYRGEPAEVGPTKAPAPSPAADADLDLAFREWEDDAPPLARAAAAR
jgi:hypothetical protein